MFLENIREIAENYGFLRVSFRFILGTETVCGLGVDINVMVKAMDRVRGRFGLLL